MFFSDDDEGLGFWKTAAIFAAVGIIFFIIFGMKGDEKKEKIFDYPASERFSVDIESKAFNCADFTSFFSDDGKKIEKIVVERHVPLADYPEYHEVKVETIYPSSVSRIWIYDGWYGNRLLIEKDGTFRHCWSYDKNILQVNLSKVEKDESLPMTHVFRSN